MATITHASLSGSSLHENKGVASASDDTVATAASGATVWKKLTADNLTETGNPFGASLFHTRDQRNAGVAFSGTITAGQWNARPLNTTITNEVSGASLGSNAVILPIGTYHARALLVGNSSTARTILQARLRDVSNATTKVLSVSLQTSNKYSEVTVWNSQQEVQNDPTGWALPLEGRFALASQATLELQLYNTSTIAVGSAANTGEVEVYTDLLIWKIA